MFICYPLTEFLKYACIFVFSVSRDFLIIVTFPTVLCGSFLLKVMQVLPARSLNPATHWKIMGLMLLHILKKKKKKKKGPFGYIVACLHFCCGLHYHAASLWFYDSMIPGNPLSRLSNLCLQADLVACPYYYPWLAFPEYLHLGRWEPSQNF